MKILKQLSFCLFCLLMLVAAACSDGNGIADEPTPGLPPHRARSVMERLRKMAEDGAAVMLITHDVELALAFCHRIAVMHDGTVVAEAAAEEFADWQRLRHPYARQLSRALPQNDFFGGEGR